MSKEEERRTAKTAAITSPEGINIRPEEKEKVSEKRSREKEERKRLKIAAKVLPELVNIQHSEEKERVSEQMSEFVFPKMKEILSKERNKEVKEELQKNTSIPSNVRKELGLDKESACPGVDVGKLPKSILKKTSYNIV